MTGRIGRLLFRNSLAICLANEGGLLRSENEGQMSIFGFCTKTAVSISWSHGSKRFTVILMHLVHSSVGQDFWPLYFEIHFQTLYDASWLLSNYLALGGLTMTACVIIIKWLWSLYFAFTPIAGMLRLQYQQRSHRPCFCNKYFFYPF